MGPAVRRVSPSFENKTTQTEVCILNGAESAERAEEAGELRAGKTAGAEGAQVMEDANDLCFGEGEKAQEDGQSINGSKHEAGSQTETSCPEGTGKAATNTKTKRRGWGWGTKASVLATAPAAAHVAVVGGINAAGFTASGIAAGSTAASWMSTVAIANGGAVPAGSTIAFLQSCGATMALTPPPVLGVLAVAGVAAIGGKLAMRVLRRKGNQNAATQTQESAVTDTLVEENCKHFISMQRRHYSSHGNEDSRPARGEGH